MYTGRHVETVCALQCCATNTGLSLHGGVVVCAFQCCAPVWVIPCRGLEHTSHVVQLSSEIYRRFEAVQVQIYLTWHGDVPRNHYLRQEGPCGGGISDWLTLPSAESFILWQGNFDPGLMQVREEGFHLLYMYTHCKCHKCQNLGGVQR